MYSTIPLGSQTQQVLREAAPTHKKKKKNSFTTGVWHPSGDTFPPSPLAARSSMPCMKTLARAITLYGGKCVLSLQITRTARFLLQSFHGALCTEQWISVLCASCDCLFTFSQGKLAAAVCLSLPIQAQASDDPDLCLFAQQNFFTASIKRRITHALMHTHTHTSSKSIK